jgi:Tol biopolymer transport system component
MTSPKINWKKFGLIVGFIAIVLLFAFILYYIFFRSFVTPTTPINAVTPSVNKLPPTNINAALPPPVTVVPAGPTPLPTPTITPTPTLSQTATPTGFTSSTPLITTTTMAASIASNGKDLVFYNSSDGKFYRMDNTGKKTPLTDKVFYNVENITWAPNTAKAILEYTDGSKIYYNFDTKEQATLPLQWKDFSFSPGSDKIAFKEMNYEIENRWVSIANPDGTGLQAIESLGSKDADVLITWSPSNQTAALYRESTDATGAKVYFIGLHGENFKALTIDGRDLRAIWSPTGDRLLYSSFSFNSSYNPSLWAANAEGDQIGTRRINFKLATWADKCSFANNTIAYCAVPKNLDSGAGYFPQLADNSPDVIYKLNLDTGAKTKVAEPVGAFSISNLMVSNDEKILYFTDKKTGQIYKIDL